ncbi:substrate-binding domain-containing protein, partial [Roseibium sp.]
NEIGICGFNDLEMMAVANPGISSVHTHRLQIGQQAMSMMDAALTGSGPDPSVIDVGFDMIARQSTNRAAR